MADFLRPRKQFTKTTMGNFTLDAPDDPCCGLNTDYDLTVSVVCGLNLIFGNVFCLFGEPS